MKYEEIDKAIKAGCKLHIFRSGSGLRVCRIEEYEGDYKKRNQVKNELVAYGEHVSLLRALKEVEENCLNLSKYETIYDIGDSNPDCELDKIILKGENIDIIPCEDAHTWREGKVVKAGDTLGNRCYSVKAVTLIITSLDVELIKIVGANVDEVLERAEIEAKYINENGVVTY